jgi:ABC-type branched-subunit amino acid transport system permease subunit
MFTLASIGQVLVNGASLSAIYVLVALGFTLLFGIMREVNFAHGAFAMLGGYALYYLWGSFGVPYIIAVPLAAAFVAVVALIAERLVFRWFYQRMFESMIGLLGLNLALVYSAVMIWDVYERSIPPAFAGLIEIHGLLLPADRLVVICIAIVVLALFWLFMTRTRHGLAMRATAQDLEIAETQGIDTTITYRIAFLIAIFMTALAGALYAQIYSLSPFMGERPLLVAFIVVILGGMGQHPRSRIGRCHPGVHRKLPLDILWRLDLVLRLVRRGDRLADRAALGPARHAGERARMTPPALVLIAALIALAAALPVLGGNGFLLTIATLAALNIIGAISLHLVIRTGHVSLAHAGFMGIGGYTATLTLMNLGWPFPLNILAGAAAPALLALLIGPVLLRLQGKYFVLVTFLLGEMLRLAFVQWSSLTGGANGIFGVPPAAPIFASPAGFYWLALGSALLCVALVARVLSGETGRVIDSVHESERLAQYAGIPVLQVKVAAFVLATALVGVQGGLTAHYLQYIDPGAFTSVQSLGFVVMNVIGGMRSLAGPIIGALFMVTLPELLGGYVEMQQVMFGIILIVVMAAFPSGLVDLAARSHRLAGRAYHAKPGGSLPGGIAGR